MVVDVPRGRTRRSSPSEYSEPRRRALQVRLAKGLGALAETYAALGDEFTAAERRREREGIEDRVP